MKIKHYIWRAVRDNSLDAFVPEVWAAESLDILTANTVMTNLVHRDFSDEIKNFGEVVNTRRPAEFEMERKTDADSVTIQDANATNVPVTLNMHPHVSFMLKDGEEARSFKDLANEYLVPAILAMGKGLDQSLLAQSYRFLGNAVGKLGVTPTKETIVAAREKLNKQLCPISGRNLVITPDTEGAFLSIADFINAEKVGDNGTALREGSLGRKFAFNTYMDQNCPSIAAGNTVKSGAVNYAAGYSAGATTLVVDGFSGAVVTGSWCTIGGDPQFITAHTETASNTTGITISPGLRYDVADNAVITAYTPGAINKAAGYAADYQKHLTIDGFSVAPKTGQLITFGTAAPTEYYGAINTPTTTDLMLDRPLVSSLADDAVLSIGPAGNYNFAFHRNALALVSRTLPKPRSGLAVSAVANYQGLGIRVTITYNGEKQGHLVTVDMLCGIALLDVNLGCVLLG